MTELPQANTERFQPLRSGLLNLFKYQDQEFWFEKGRLLVRGNNGTGKSRVLALQLPFLFDGEISSRRVEPDGDPARQMAWHLLMDEQYEQRTGYTWIEFGKRDANGVEHYITLGCGMKAVRGGDNQPTRWFFITSKRVRGELALVDGNTPRSAERLAESLDSGDFFTKTAKEYRAEVNRRLFGLSGSAYSALIELLIRLRAPQLSKKLEEKTLFEALSNALPHLGDDVVDDVATAFKQLDEQRQQYQMLRDLQGALSQFCSHYQSYLKTVLVRRSHAVTAANSRFETAQKDVSKLQQTCEAGEARKSEAEHEVSEAKNHLTACDADLAALQSRPEANQAADLDNARQKASDKKNDLTAAMKRLEDASANFHQKDEEHQRQTEVVSQALGEHKQLVETAIQEAGPTGFSPEHANIVPSAGHWPQSIKDLGTLRQRHKQKATDHLYRLSQIKAESQKAEAASDKLEGAQHQANVAQEQMDDAKAHVQRHQQDATSAIAVLSLEYRSWRERLRWIQVPPWSDLASSFEDWLETDAAEHRMLADVISDAQVREVALQASVQTSLQNQKEGLRQQIGELEHEAEDLAKSPTPPSLPKVRCGAMAARKERPGAALWQLCDFQPHLDDKQCTGLEAALEAAGLLDAWISPDGHVSLSEMPADTFFQLDPSSTLLPRSSLDHVLHLDDASPYALKVPRIVLRNVLRQIAVGNGDGRHWVSLDGQWQLGPLSGRGEKTFAEFLGTRSRESARMRRLQEIDAEKQRLSFELDKIESEMQALKTRQSEALAEATSVPKDTAVANSLTLRTESRKILNKATAHFDSKVQEAELARKESTKTREELKQLAVQLGYGDHLEHLDKLEPAWGPYALTMSDLWNKSEALITAAGHLSQAESARRKADEVRTNERDHAQKAETAYIEANQTFLTKQSTAGLSIQAYQDKLSGARHQKILAVARQEQAHKELTEIEKQLAGVQGQIPGAQEKVSAAEKDREGAIRALRMLAEAGLLREADERLAEIDTQLLSASRAVLTARSINRELSEVDHDDSIWTQRLNALDGRINDLRTSAASHCRIEREELSEGVILVTCEFQGARLRPGECLFAVEKERETRDRLLAEEERKIIDRHLITEVSVQLQQLIEQAHERTRKINKEMEKCATTLGVAMRLVWETQTEGQHPSLAVVRKLLLMDHAVWSDEQRHTVGAFLQQLIQDERIKNPAAPASEQLLTALDYRRWHAFAAERHQNGRWERLTRKRYGTGSGGEKALMLTIPQMAAASSHYRSAAKHAPRFILLDEAFAGMDKPTRGRCMGLLEAFDLDLMMTSEREHGAHASISGIAIYHLMADSDAVAATRWIWNGSQPCLAPVPDTPELREKSPPIA